MTDKIPHFKFHIKSSASRFCGRIELKGEVIHTITNFGEFYKACGFDMALAKKGMLPDEYIWETFFKHDDRNCTSCFQLHIIEYLFKYSDSFTKKLRHQCDELIEAHAAKRAACTAKDCADRKK